MILDGQTFGLWTVLRRATRNDYWVCICKCGVVKEVRQNTLRSGKSGSCGGCERKYWHKYSDPNQTHINRLIYNYQRSAKRRNLKWDLTAEQVSHIMSAPCYYCGRIGSNTQPPLRGSSRSQPFKYNGIDRKDPSDGYTPSNSVSCCNIHNYMKGVLSENEFITECQNVVSFQRGDVARTATN